MKTTAANIEVIQNRVRMTKDYSEQEYQGDRPLLNWSAFLTRLAAAGVLENSPSFKNNRK